MITILKLELDDYKQFAGHHEIAFPEQGAVAVIGHNGAGKTTLFEAIEWALYGRVGKDRFRNEDLLPRTAAGKVHPRVAVTLQTRDGKLFRVERRYQSGIKAAIHEVGEDGEIGELLVDGRDKVSQYVANRLVGLGHQAFTSTFFTRQKELSFFGDLKDTDRRREVAKLLGHETIQGAQQEIAEQRKGARRTAEQYRFGLTQIAGDRDLDAEKAQATAAIEVAESARTEALTREASGGSRLEAAQKNEDTWRDMQARDQAIAARIADRDREIATCAERIGNANNELARLAAREGELDALRPVAEREVALQATVDRWATKKDKDAQRRRLFQRRTQIDRERDGAIGTIREIVAQSLALPVPGWEWRERDEADPGEVAARLAAVARDLDPAAARAQADGLLAADRHAAEFARAGDHLDKCERMLAQLGRELADLLVPGDPDELIRQATEARTAASKEAAAAEARANGERGEARKLRQAIGQLERSGEGECPTCRRPIDEHVIATLGDSIAQRNENAAYQDGLAAAARESLAAAERDEDQARARQRELATKRERIANGESRTEEARAARRDAGIALTSALAAVALDVPPTGDAIGQAQRRAETYTSVAGHAPRLLDIAAASRDRAEEDRQIGAEIERIGQVHYDRDAHRQTEADLGAARQALGRLREIEADLARRSRLTALIEETTARRDEHGRERQALLRERAEVGFDDDSLTEAVERSRAAQAEFNAAVKALHAAEKTLSDATRLRQDIEAVERQLAETRLKAAEADAEHDLLDRMYAGFNEFEKWVAERMNPHLAERTGELLREVTAGKYDHVRFDEDYGLHVSDAGEDFAVERFSGGERDVAALCARLALSKVVSAQATNPPAFIVLDEVFGSLDQERRQNLLGTLDALTGDEVEGFKQLFIISHVDDIRGSQAFDHIWRITESSAGVSHWETIPVTGGIDE